MANKPSTLTVEEVLLQISLIEKMLADLKAKFLSSLPAKYGSDAWWEKVNKQALEEIRRGEYIEVKNAEELDKYFADL